MLGILSCKAFEHIEYIHAISCFVEFVQFLGQLISPSIEYTLLLYLASQQLIRETTVTSLSLCAVWRWRRVSRKRGWRKKRGGRWRCILCCNKTLVVAGAGNRELKTVASSKVPSDVKQRHRTQEVRTVHITNSKYCYQDWLILEIRKETVISLVTGQQNSHIAFKISSTILQQCWSSTWIIQLHETFRTNAELKFVATATTGSHVTFLLAV